MENKCKSKIGVQRLRDYPIDNLESIPDYILAERDIEDESDGSIKTAIVRVPGLKLFPNANMDNITGLAANNAGIVIPENQVRACRIVNDGSQITMQYADTNNRAQFLAVGQVADTTLVQNTGFVILPNGHEYVPGVTYYVGDNGEPTADSTSGQKLFIPVSKTKLAIIGDWG